MKRWKEPSSKLLQKLLTGLLIGSFGFLFYASPLRDQVEHKLFDLRTRMAPKVHQANDVVVVDLPVEQTTPERYTSILQILALHPRVVTFLVAPPYDLNEIQSLISIARDDPRFIIGAFDVTRKEWHVQDDRNHFVASASLEQYYWKSIVRSLPFLPTKRQRQNIPYLLPKMASIYTNSFSIDSLLKSKIQSKVGVENSYHFRLNYYNPDSIAVVDFKSLHKPDSKQMIQDKAVIVGHQSYTPRGPTVGVSNFANTPWQEENGELALGYPATSILATGLQNLISGRWLHEASVYWHVMQILLFGLGSFLIWRLGSALAAMIFLVFWMGVLLLHAFLFSMFSLSLPLADTLFFSIIGTIAGGLHRLNIEGKKRTENMEQEQSNREVSEIQNRFLDRLAVDLKVENKNILSLLENMKRPLEDTSQLAEALRRAYVSAEELDEFLVGIQQFATIKSTEINYAAHQWCDAESLIKKTVNRCDSIITQKNLLVTITGTTDTYFFSDPVLLDQILYNLISNACKYSTNQGKVQISTSIDLNTQITISIEDDGPGIADDMRELIFEKFYRIKNDQVYQVKGHGLGLYLSRFFAKSIGAEISLSSKLGSGTTFFLKLKGERR